MIKLPLVNLFITLNNLSNDILTTQLSDDEDIGKFLGLLKVSSGELIILDLIRCIILTSVKRKDLLPLDINYFSPSAIEVTKGDYYEYSLCITETFPGLENLIFKKDKEYVMYIHSLFTFYGLISRIDKYYSEVLTDDLVRQKDFWIDFNNIMYNLEQLIKGMEMNYPGDSDDKAPLN